MYKSRKIILSCAALAAVLIGTLSFLLGTDATGKEADRDTVVINTVVQPAANIAYSGYYLSIDNGYVAVFYNDEVVFTSDIEAETLRVVDRELLKEGIRANSYEEILLLLEDFGS